MYESPLLYKHLRLRLSISKNIHVHAHPCEQIAWVTQLYVFCEHGLQIQELINVVHACTCTCALEWCFFPVSPVQQCYMYVWPLTFEMCGGVCLRSPHMSSHYMCSTVTESAWRLIGPECVSHPSMLCVYNCMWIFMMLTGYSPQLKWLWLREWQTQLIHCLYVVDIAMWLHMG